MGSLFSTLTAPSNEEESSDSSPVVAVHTIDQWNTHFNAAKNTSKLVVIDFKASWCGPCRFIEPAIKEMASKFMDVLFLKVDVDELPVVSQEWGIRAMPTFVLAKGGKKIDEVVGAMKEELLKKIEMHRV